MSGNTASTRRRSTRLSVGLVLVALLATTLPGVAAGKEKGKDACKKGGWIELVDTDGEPFASQGDCVSFAAQGGTASPPSVESILAVAYTDMNAVDGDYDPSVDVLIAKLVDTNGDNEVSVGDTVVTGEYPKGFDPGTAGFGSFGVTSHPVTDLFPGAGEFAVLSGGLDKFFIWDRTFEREVYSEYDRTNAPATYTEFTDVIAESLIFVDTIYANTVSPSNPDENVSGMSREQTSDDAFFDVDLNAP